MAVVTLTKDNFEETINSGKTVLVDFWASRCGPCKMLSPVVDSLADELTDVIVGKVNVDEEQDIAVNFGIMSIPTLIVFKDGKPVRQSTGVIPKQAIIDLLG